MDETIEALEEAIKTEVNNLAYHTEKAFLAKQKIDKLTEQLERIKSTFITA